MKSLTFLIIKIFLNLVRKWYTKYSSVIILSFFKESILIINLFSMFYFGLELTVLLIFWKNKPFISVTRGARLWSFEHPRSRSLFNLMLRAHRRMSTNGVFLFNDRPHLITGTIKRFCIYINQFCERISA